MDIGSGPFFSGIQSIPTSYVTTKLDRRLVAANAANKRAVASNVATMTTYTEHGYIAGDVVTLASCGDAAYNGARTLLSVPSTTTFTFALTHADETETTDNAVTFSTPAIRAIPGLSATLQSGGTYVYRVVLFTTASTGALVCDMAGGTVTVTSASRCTTALKATSLGVTISTNLTTDYVGASSQLAVIIEGLVVVNAGGTLAPQFAQNAGNATASSVLVNSYMQVWSV